MSIERAERADLARWTRKTPASPTRAPSKVQSESGESTQNAKSEKRRPQRLGASVAVAEVTQRPPQPCVGKEKLPRSSQVARGEVEKWGLLVVIVHPTVSSVADRDARRQVVQL